jgi:hypothetical protein
MSDLQQIEVSLQECRGAIEKMEAFERLLNNRDFKLVIEQGFLQDEAVRSTWALADPELQGAENQEMLRRIQMGIGYLRQYFNKIVNQGRQAQKMIVDLEETRSEIMQES